MDFKYLTVSILLVFIGVGVSNAQKVFQLDHNKSTLLISGTSSIHDWEMEAVGEKGQAVFNLSGESVSDIQNAHFMCPVSGIKSDNKIMDKKTYKALKEEDFPEITFLFQNHPNGSATNNQNEITGQLSIAGQNKTITLKVNTKVISENEITATGSVPLKMTDFGVTPPTAIMGTLKTGDEVVIKFDLVFTGSGETVELN